MRFDDMLKRNAIPQDVLAELPPAELYAKAVFPTIEQLNAARAAIAENWDKVVGADVK